MIVVADSGPLHYLILLEQIELLWRFYGQVLVPEPVASELSAAGAPAIVREWITKPPTWVDVRPVTPDAVSMITDDLDLGERAAIALAETMHADGLVGARVLALWLDERDCRSAVTQISGLRATLSTWSSRGSRPIPAKWGEFRVFAVFGFPLRLSLPSWLKGRPQRVFSRCTPTSRLTTSARRCSLRPKPSANERCPSPPANEVPDRQRAFASARRFPATGRS